MILRLENGEAYTIRILIDQGSEISLISEEIIRKYRLQRSAGSIPLTGIGNTFSGRTKGVVSLRLQSIHEQSSYCQVQAFIMSKLTTRLPHFNVNYEDWPHIKNLPLADPDFHRPGPIHVILGSDTYGKIIATGLIKDDPALPIAQETIFGWVLSGPISLSETTPKVYGFNCAVDQDLQECLTRFWTQEEVSDKKELILNEEEEECELHYKATHSRDKQGRYIVRLPRKANTNELGDSKEAALRSMKRLSIRLAKDRLYKQRYETFIEEYKSLGHMIPVPTPDRPTSRVFYLPHHGVLREESTTTKLRVVFNYGSARTSNGLSLNDLLHTGAKQQKDVAEVLLWSRIHRFIFSTDVVKMFRQIIVHPDDRDLQRILWQDSREEITHYQLTTVTSIALHF